MITLLHSQRHLKQNWCMQESVKHLRRQRDKQIAQLGGGEDLPPADADTDADALVPGSPPVSPSPDSLPLSVRSANFMAAAGSVNVPWVVGGRAPGSTITEPPTSSWKNVGAGAWATSSATSAMLGALRWQPKYDWNSGKVGVLCLLWPALLLLSLSLHLLRRLSLPLARYIIWFAIRSRTVSCVVFGRPFLGQRPHIPTIFQSYSMAKSLSFRPALFSAL